MTLELKDPTNLGRPGKKKRRGCDRVLEEFFTLLDNSPYTVKSIQKHAGLADDTVYRWRMGDRTPTISNLIAVAQAIGYELRWAKIGDK